MFYRTYTKDWTPTGHGTERQYPGQVGVPPCHCGAPAERMMAFNPREVRRCKNGHLSGADSAEATLVLDQTKGGSVMLKLAKALVKAAWRRWRYRSARTGKFVSKEEAKRSPDTTVRERV